MATIFLKGIPVRTWVTSIVGLLLVSISAQAQDSSSDLAQNDPSLQPQIRSWFPAPQLWIAAKRLVARSFEKADEKTFRIFSSDSPPLPAYADLLTNHPELWQAFAPIAHRYRPSAEHGPALINADHEFKGITDREYGLCWGFATLVRQFATLAIYRPDQSIPKKPNRAAWIRFYQKRIDAVISGKRTEFPGFKNWRELSRVPALEFYLKRYTMELWAQRAVRTTSIPIVQKATHPLSPSEVDELLIDLENRLRRFEMPKIIFSSRIPSQPLLGFNTDIHVVLVYDVIRNSDGGARIYVWDINFYGETLAKSPKFIEITPQRKLYYEPWFNPNVPYAAVSAELSQVSLAPENDVETVRLLLELNRNIKKK